MLGFGGCEGGVDAVALLCGCDTEYGGCVGADHEEALAEAGAVFSTEGSVELSDLTGDFVGAVAFVEFEVGGALEEFAHALMLLNAGELEKNLAVVVLKHLDIGRNHAVGVDTRTEDVGGGVVDAVLDLGLEDGGDVLVALALLHDGVEHHGVVGAGVKGAVLLDEGPDIV